MIIENGDIIEDDNRNLIDVGRHKNNAKTKLHTTALNHFNKFLKFTNSAFISLDDIPIEAIEDKLMGLQSLFISFINSLIK